MTWTFSPRASNAAVRTTSLEPLKDAIITYEITIQNTGNHFSNVTGKYVAPVQGVYFFTFHMMHQSKSKNMDVILMKNNRGYDRGLGCNVYFVQLCTIHMSHMAD